ncbi:MAG: glycosyltransferase family 39 protein [Candidatus Levybacteria bacterium]|nr:glycosyltransferase family 39 protein [Candidatus Levybacteria bacterium]
MSNKIQYLLLYLILVFAFSLRIYGISWDSGNHLHPDERAIILSVLGLRFPTSIESFLSPESSWNTHFFAYGSFPFYLLKILGDIASIFDPSLSGYDGIQLVGRFISSIFDVGTVLVLFFLGKKLKGERVGLLAAFFYAISVLPIQLSHFYAVDTPLTFFITLTLLLLIRFYEKPTLLRSLLVGIFFGFALATKISAIVITATIGITLTIDFLLIFLKRPHRLDVWGPHLPPFTKRLLKDAIIFIVATIFTYLILSPYTFIDFLSFQRQTAEQSAMTKNAFTFPYTLQYVGKTPYFYELKNIFLYGIGPLLAAVCFVGLIIFLLEMVKKYRSIDFAKHTILIVFFIAYFGVVGGFAIGFMRYMLPLYPLLCLFGSVLIYKLLTIFPPRPQNGSIKQFPKEQQ